jgi:hypothetical protein
METGLKGDYELRRGRLYVNGEPLPIRGSVIRSALAEYARRTGRSYWTEAGSRLLPVEAAEWILTVERQAALGVLETDLEGSVSAA